MSNNQPPQELVNLVKELDANGIKVFARRDGADLLIQCDYKDKIKKDKRTGFDLIGRGPALVEHISRSVFRYYPKAEMTSQAPNMFVVYKLNAR
jgi:hypothetical protein